MKPLELKSTVIQVDDPSELQVELDALVVAQVHGFAFVGTHTEERYSEEIRSYYGGSYHQTVYRFVILYSEAVDES